MKVDNIPVIHEVVVIVRELTAGHSLLSIPRGYKETR